MKVSRPKKAKPTLMLTSLLDMFTIILIFLIVSYDAEDKDFQLDSNLTLPESAVEGSFQTAANVSVSQVGVSVEGVRITSFAETPPDPDGESIPEVVEALEKVRLVMEAEAAGKDGPTPEEPIVLLQADKGLKYSTLYLVMRSARVAGFSKYRLAVMKQ